MPNLSNNIGGGQQLPECNNDHLLNALSFVFARNRDVLNNRYKDIYVRRRSCQMIDVWDGLYVRWTRRAFEPHIKPRFLTT